MNKDMENTFNQMAELGGSDERLGTNTTPIINAPLLPMNTRRAAPVEGLDTVLWANRNAMKLAEKNFLWEVLVSNRENYPHYDHALVSRSQAEAIIAAKDAKIADLENELSSFRSSFKEQTSLKADNAALTTRVKELENSLADARDIARNASSNSIYWRSQYEALKDENEKKQKVKWDADGF